ncbi:MAG: hypothetical protein EXR54_09030 [Dehalococcoidia bacterium]|nr:hypothetical protein [Dehalococcoidia bacterium]
MQATLLTRATLAVAEKDLEYMALGSNELPPELRGYRMAREGLLDNENMAKHGFTGSSGERYRQAGRINGYSREFAPPSGTPAEDGANFVAATVAHLFESPEAVSRWMRDIFLKDFEGHVGKSMGQGSQLISVSPLSPAGFFDEAVALRVLQGSAKGLASSTVIDFRVGRILGVVFVGTVGDHQRLELATELGQTLEKRIVRVALGAA